jgi:hypothetical protein
VSGGQVREKGFIKKKSYVNSNWLIIERLLPHPAFSHLLPNGEGDINEKFTQSKLVDFLKRWMTKNFPTQESFLFQESLKNQL